MHLMVIGITMEMNSTAFSKACSTVTFRQQKNLFDKCNIFVELGTGKMVTSNDPEDSNQFDEVGDRPWVS